MKDPRAEGARWLEQARRDLDAARTILENELWWVACFQSQQAAEKAVKARLYASGERMVLGHSVAELIDQAARNAPEFSDLRARGARLDRYYIITRYPNGLPGGIPADAFAEEDARQAVSAAADIIRCVERSVE